MKYYHFLSDQRTVREISFEEYQKIIRQDQAKVERWRMVVAVGKHWLNIHTGSRFVFLDTRQIEQVLLGEKKEA